MHCWCRRSEVLELGWIGKECSCVERGVCLEMLDGRRGWRGLASLWEEGLEGDQWALRVYLDEYRGRPHI